MKKLISALAFLLLFAPVIASAQPADPTGSKGSFVPYVRSSSLTVTTSGDKLVFPVWGREGLALSVITSDLVATLNIEASVDGGATYDTTGVFASMVQYGLSYGASLNTGGTNLRRMIAVGGGVTHVRINASVVSSGTGVISLTATESSGSIPDYATPVNVASSSLAQETGGNLDLLGSGMGFPTAPVPFRVFMLGGSDGTDVQAVAVNASGEVSVAGTFWQATQPVSGPLTDTQLRATPVPISGTVTTTPPSNASTNVAQVGGTATDTNSGNKSAGTLRVVIATDQPALTNKLLVTPDLPSGASTAAKQPALGTAGSASADVITVQGIASMTPISVSGSTVSSANSPGSCVSVTTGNTTVLASFSTRKTAILKNECDNAYCSSEVVYYKLGATATTSSMPIAPGEWITITGYTGIIDAISPTATNKVCAQEF